MDKFETEEYLNSLEPNESLEWIKQNHPTFPTHEEKKEEEEEDIDEEIPINTVEATNVQSISRPVWVPNNSQPNCKNCKAAFNFIVRRHHCRYCGEIFCDSCSSFRVSFPLWFEYSNPERICILCLPSFFKARAEFAPNSSSPSSAAHKFQLNLFKKLKGDISSKNNNNTSNSSPTSPNTTRSSSNLNLSNFLSNLMGGSNTTTPITSSTTQYQGGYFSLEDNSFHTCEGDLPFTYNIFSPVCAFAFQFSGMYTGGKFDRSVLHTAALSIPVPVIMEKVEVIKKGFIEVPKQWKLVKDSFEAPGPAPSFVSHSSPNLNHPSPLLNSVSAPSLSKGSSPSPVNNVEKNTFQIPIQVFVPPIGVGPFPILLWFHGGGFCIGSIEHQVYQIICRYLCNKVGCIVIAVEYRLAPEYKFPTQIEDSYAALLWAYENADRMNGDRKRIAVAGDSAGGSISAILTILARDRRGPKLCHQVLVYPCITNPLNDHYKSHYEFENGPVITKPILTWFMNQLYENMEEGLQHPFSNLLLHESFENLPPATIINARCDPLCDHGAAYADRLREFGVPVSRTVYSRSIHGFYGTTLGESMEAMVETVCALISAFKVNPIHYH